MAKPGPKDWSPTEREGVMARVAELDLCGYSQTAIGEVIGTTQATVSAFLQKIRQRYRDEVLQDHAALVYQKRQEYRYVRRLAYEAYVKSLEDAHRVTETNELRAVVTDDDDETVAGKGGKKRGKGGQIRKMEAQMRKVKEVIEREGRLPGAQYLNIILRTMELECVLLGLDEPARMDVNQVNLDWTELLKVSAGGRAGADVIEGKIAEASAPLPNGLQELPPHSTNGETNGV